VLPTIHVAPVPPGGLYDMSAALTATASGQLSLSRPAITLLTGSTVQIDVNYFNFKFS
jgi:hypothetical protein